MFEQDFPFGQAFGAGGIDVLAADFFEEDVFGQNGGNGQAAGNGGGNGQGDVPKIVGDFSRSGELVPVVARQSALRKPGEEAAAAEQHQQQQAEHEGRDGVADEDDEAGQGIETAAVAHGFHDAQRDADEVGEEEGPQAEAHGNGQLLADEFGHGFVVEEAVAEVEAGKTRQHFAEAGQWRFVETVEGVEGGDVVGTQARAACRAAAARCRFRRRTAAGKFRHQLFHRTAGHELDNQEGEREYAEQGGNQQKQAFEQVGQHGRYSSGRLKIIFSSKSRLTAL